ADVVGSYWNPYAQYKPKVIDPPGEVLPESEIYWRLAQIMDFDAGAAGIPDPGGYDSWLTERISHTPGFIREELMQTPVIPDQNEHPAYGNMKYETPSGRIELWSDRAAKLWGANPLPTYEPLNDFGEGHLPLRLM